MSEEVIKKIWFSIDTSKAVGIAQILAKLSDGLAVLLSNISNLSIKLSPFPKLSDGLAVLLSNISNLSIKLSPFPEVKVYKIAELKPIFKKGARTDP